MEQNSSSAQEIAAILLPEKYTNSPNKDRSLENVLFKDVNALQQCIIGEIKPQNDKDYDMMYKVAVSAGKGRFAGNLTSSQLIQSFDKVYGGAKAEYQFLEEMYDQEEVQKNIDYQNDMHGSRDRYSDIVTYFKSQVQLLNGVGQTKHDQYINCCFVNNIFTFDETDQTYGNKKIIAS